MNHFNESEGANERKKRDMNIHKNNMVQQEQRKTKKQSTTKGGCVRMEQLNAFISQK